MFACVCVCVHVSPSFFNFDAKFMMFRFQKEEIFVNIVPCYDVCICMSIELNRKSKPNKSHVPSGKKAGRWELNRMKIVHTDVSTSTYTHIYVCLCVSCNSEIIFMCAVFGRFRLDCSRRSYRAMMSAYNVGTVGKEVKHTHTHSERKRK